MLKYTLGCANRYFRLLHHEGLWLEPATSMLVVEAGDEMCASWLAMYVQGYHPTRNQLPQA